MDREKDGTRNFEPAPRLVGEMLGEDQSTDGRESANSGLLRDAGRQFKTFDRRVKSRIRCFFAAILLLLGIVMYRVCSIGIIHRGRYLQECLKLASQKGTFPPPRGCIFDCSGLKLAWSERFFDLYLASDLPQSITLPRALDLAQKAVRGILPSPVRTPNGLLLKRKLSVRELTSLKGFLRRYPFFYVKQRIERLQINDPRVRSVLGTVRDGHGISGLEKKHDRLLAGIPGHYTILLDRNRRPIPQTLELRTPPVPGKDLRLPQQLKDLQEVPHEQ